jgi:hypothetical protein
MPTNTNMIVAGRDTLAYTGPWAAANTFPAVSAWGVAPSGTTPVWTHEGYTKDGLHISWRMQFREYTVDQLLDPVFRIPESRDLRSRVSLGQLDPAALVVATGQGTSSSSAAATGVRGVDSFVLTSTLAALYYSTYFDARIPNSGEAARFVLWKGRSVGDINIDENLADVAQVNMEHAAVPDDSVNPARIAELRVYNPALP